MHRHHLGFLDKDVLCLFKQPKEAFAARFLTENTMRSCSASVGQQQNYFGGCACVGQARKARLTGRESQKWQTPSLANVEQRALSENREGHNGIAPTMRVYVLAGKVRRAAQSAASVVLFVLSLCAPKA